MEINKRRLRISFDGTNYITQEFFSKEQIIAYIKTISLPVDMSVHIGYVVDANRELERHVTSIGKDALQSMTSWITQGSIPMPAYTDAVFREVGKVIIENVSQKVDFSTLTSDIVRRIGSPKIKDLGSYLIPDA